MTDTNLKTVVLFQNGSLRVSPKANASTWSYLTNVMLEAHVAATGTCVSATAQGRNVDPAVAVQILRDHGYGWFGIE